jgi:hypothetical protein
MLALPTMNWRRFTVLLRGLGPNSIFALLSANEESEEKTANEKPDINKPIDNKQAIKAIAGW